MGVILNLESFDDQPMTSDVEIATAATTYEDGFQDGLAQAAATYEAEQLNLRANVVEALSDQNFGYLEAQTHFLEGMRSFLSTTLNVVLPEVLAPALHFKIRQLLLSAVERDAAKPIYLRLPPDQVAPCEAIIADLELNDLKIVADPNLTEHAAMISGAVGETSIDLDALLIAIHDSTRVIFEPSTEVS